MINNFYDIGIEEYLGAKNKELCDDGDKDKSDVIVTPGASRFTATTSTKKEARKDFSPEPLEIGFQS